MLQGFLVLVIMSKKIAIIGGGNLGQSIALGLLSMGFPPKSLSMTRNRTELLSKFKSKGVFVSNNNIEAVKKSDVVILAIKPYKLKEVLVQIRTVLRNDQILISVVSDYPIERIQSHISSSPSIFRAMPNTASSVNQSLTCIATINGTRDDAVEVKSIFDALGTTIEINEQLMDASTVLGACGIAFVLRFVRAMIQGGIEIGFDVSTATDIATQTVKGATELLLQNSSHPEAEIDKVTTPKGCTIAGLNEMEHRGFSSALIKGIKTSYQNISD